MTNIPATIHDELPAVIEHEPEPLDQWAYEQIRAELARDPRRYPYYLLTLVLRATGLRVHEVMGSGQRTDPDTGELRRTNEGLTPAHVAVNGPETFLSVKRGKRRDKAVNTLYERVPLQAEVAAQLHAYTARLPRDQRIWAGFSVRTYQRVFRQASIAAVGEAHHPHELRGLYCVDLLDAGTPLAVVSKMLGHTNTETTLRFYTRVTSRDKAAINARVRA